MNIDTLNAYCGQGSVLWPRPSEGRRSSTHRRRLVIWRPELSQSGFVILKPGSVASNADPAASQVGRPTSFLGKSFLTVSPSARPLGRGGWGGTWLGLQHAFPARPLPEAVRKTLSPLPFPTSDRTRLPAEFKHITKRRKRN